MVAISRLVSLLGLCGASTAFTIYNATNLESKNIGDVCVKALTANIACPTAIRPFMAPRVHASLRNVTLTEEICTEACSASLREWFNTVVSACADEDFGDGVPQRVGGFIWAGWNETCIKDPKTKKYCNDIIDSFTDVEDGGDMPRDELCNVCYERKLAMMQSSPYSVYNHYYQSQLEKVYETCGRSGSVSLFSVDSDSESDSGSGSTEIPPPLTVEETMDFCLSKKYYTTKEGDTCDSIAKGNPGIAGVFLYMGNQELIADCRKIPAGIKLCLPTTCPTYVVKPDDTCWSIERAQGLYFDDVEHFNSWINIDCSNLHKATDFYGKTICVGAFGSNHVGTWVDEEDKEADVASPDRQLRHSSANGPVPRPQVPEE